MSKAILEVTTTEQGATPVTPKVVPMAEWTEAERRDWQLLNKRRQRSTQMLLSALEMARNPEKRWL